MSTESALGTEATWKAGVPAITCLIFFVCTAAYGRWVLPRRLHATYQHEHAELVASQLTNPIEDVRDLESELEKAGDLDVVYARLVELEANSPSRYFEWSRFRRDHAERIRSAIENPLASFPEELLEEATIQAATLAAEAEKTLRELAVSESKYSGLALLELARDRLRDPMESVTSAVYIELAQELKKSNFTSASDQTEADSLVTQLLFEGMWYSKPTDENQIASVLVPQEDALSNLREHISETACGSLPCLAASAYLQVLDGGEPDVPNELLVEFGPDTEAFVAAIRCLAIEGKWQQMIELVGITDRNLDDVRPLITRELLRAVSVGHSLSLEQRTEGILLAYRLAPFSPEVAEAVWRMCGSEEVQPDLIVFDELGQQVVESGTSSIVHVILTLRNANDETLSINHAKLTARDPLGSTLLTHVIFWRVRVGSLTKKLGDNLLSVLHVLQANSEISGLVHLCAALIHGQLDHAAEARSEAKLAQETLGNIPIIQELLHSQ